MDCIPHVGREVAENAVEGNLIVDHLVLHLCLGEGRGILVRPGVTGNLVPFGDHALQKKKKD